MISYGQNHEDVILSRAFPECKDGFYLDVGANEPVTDSVTKHFFDLGWRGINIEPVKALHERLCSHRQGDINLNVGLSNREGSLELIEFPNCLGLTTFSPDMARLWRSQGMESTKRTVPVTTLAQVCEAHVDRPIDFLKIDVEGHEREVIEGGDWSRWRPRVVLVEATWPEKWEPMLLNADYFFVLFDGLNCYYLRAEDRHLQPAFDAPANPRDNFIGYSHHLAVEQLNALRQQSMARSGELGSDLAQAAELGADSIRVAKMVHLMAVKYPWMSWAVKRIVRLVA